MHVGDESLCDTISFKLFIAILENKTTLNKEEGFRYSLLPMGRWLWCLGVKKTPSQYLCTDVSGLETSHSTSNINTVQSLSIIFHP